jgi:MtfA peptidase
MFGLLRKHRRRRILERKAIGDAVWRDTIAALPALARLGDAGIGRLRDLTLLFVEEKQIVGAGGLELDEAMRVRIGALACQLVLELGFDWYDHVITIIVYPDEFVVRDREVLDDDGVAHIGDDVLSGEAWEQGPLVLAWADVEASGRGDGYNVVAHEFAHKLDLLTGATDGMPPLHRGMSAAGWSGTFQAAYDALCTALDRGEETWVDPYAAEAPAEFFAVCTELFFDTPDDLAEEYPDIYAELSAFFRQSPVRAEPP